MTNSEIPQAASDGKASPASSGAGPLLLVIDDDPPMRDLICDILREHGFSVVCVGNGEEALAAIRDGLQPSAILLDLLLPRLGGEGALALLHYFLEDEQPAKVVIVTARQEARLSDFASYPEVIDLVRKPFDLDELVSAASAAVAAARATGARTEGR